MNVTTLVNETALIPEIASLLHDLRNPLSVIHSGAELLSVISEPEPQPSGRPASERPEMATPHVRRLTRNLYTASLVMKEMIDDFLSRYRGTAPATEPCDLRELIGIAIGKITFAAELQSIQIVQTVPANLVITLNRQRIQQVFVNLLVNALEAMPDGGTIRISAILQRHSVLIKVRDNGPGIAPEIRGRLFRDFATAGKVNGLGLGLAFSRKAVLDHGGDIWAESSRDGACIAVRLSMPRSAGCVPAEIARAGKATARLMPPGSRQPPPCTGRVPERGPSNNSARASQP